MPKPTSEEIKRKKEYVRFLQGQIFKLKSNHRFLQKKLEQTAKELADYEQEKEQIEQWLKEVS